MLKTKSILAKKEESDGVRISVMSKHNWKGGLIPYTEITNISVKMYDVWERKLSPPKKLVWEWYQKKLSWEQFEENYLKYLKTVYDEIETISRRAMKENITLLCLEKTPEYCHRRLLAEECKKVFPELEIIIK